MRNRCLLLLAGLVAFTASQAQAHFLFIRIVAPTDGKRNAEVYFSDRADAGDPEFIEKIAHTRLWVQPAPGKFQVLDVKKGEDRLQAALPGKGSLMVIGECRYGVLPRKTPFLLRHFPKSMAGTAAELNQLRPFEKAPLEILARIEKDGLHLTVVHNGKPLPNAPINTLALDLSGEKLQADAKGEFHLKLPRPGYYTVYTSRFSKEAGKLGDQKYEEIRDFATLSFPWPLE